ncbi:serpin A3-8 [Equus przewalskii]|nr:alpha-1-antichymotrypsin [Equus caballus]XP_005605485.1 alpha-1-antichymotrypsin [Equus caballus]
MSPLLALGLLVAGLCPTVHCLPGDMPDSGNVAQEDQPNRTSVDNLRLTTSNTDFAFHLYKLLAAQTPNENVIFSPLSISIALAFLSLGARNTTLTEILEGLKFNLTETPETEIHQGFQHLLHTLSQPNPQQQLSVGNAMFLKEELELLDKFREDAKALYASEAFPTDFKDPAAAEKLINDYVEKKTEGKIVHLVGGLCKNTMMVLVNYILLKAKWKTPFDPGDTYESAFHVSRSRSVQVPKMSFEERMVPFFRDEELACTVVELQYISDDSALFILPDEGQLGAVEAALLPETLRRWRASLRMRWIDELYLPKFSISSNYELETILTQLGIEKVFTTKADLSGVTGTPNLYVTQVVHSTVLDVAEEGTEAAAATGINIAFSSGVMNPLIVDFNRPFLLFIISKDTQSILFGGKVVDPSQAPH